MKVSEDEGIEGAIQKEAIARFYHVIYKLPESEREILLCTIRGESVGEIAGKLNIPETEVKRMKKKAYLYLHKNLSDGFGLTMALLFD